jgi:hypothetical protein
MEFIGKTSPLFRDLSLFFLFGLLSLVTMVRDGNADPITFGFTGNVIGVNGLTDTFNTSQTLSGFLTFESSTQGVIEEDAVEYPGAVIDLRFTVGPYTGTFGGRSSIVVGDNVCCLRNILRFDVFDVSASFVGNVGDARPAELGFGLRLVGPTNAFSDTALPLVPPPLEAFSFPSVTVRFESPTDSPFIQAILTTPTSIPESSTLVLVGSGLFGLLLRRRRIMNRQPLTYRVITESRANQFE